MKSRVLIIMWFAMFCCTQSHAQSFLENLGQSIKKEIKNEVKKGVEQKVSEGIDKLKDTIEKGKESGKESTKQDNTPKTAVPSKADAKPVVNPTDVPIITMNTWRLVVKDGKPHYKFLDSASSYRENFILYDIQYEHPDGVEPFMFTTAVEPMVGERQSYEASAAFYIIFSFTS